MNRYASFFKGCRFKNTIVDGHSVVALKNQQKINKQLNAAETQIFYTVLCMPVETGLIVKLQPVSDSSPVQLSSFIS